MATLKAKKPLKAKTPLKAKKNPKKKPANSVAKLKKQADKYFSLACRLRFADYVNGEWVAECITCKQKLPIKKLQCGHFMSRMHNITRYDEENTASQCLTADSTLRMFNGRNKSIADIKVGDELWAFNEIDFQLEKSIVEVAESFMPDELYEVTLENNSKFYATADHRVVSNGQWIFIKDMLHNVSTHNILEL